MATRVRSAAALLALAAVTALPHAARSADDEAAEGRRERLIARYLEAGRTSEALVEAEAGAKAFPESGIIRRRLAQAHLCETLRIDSQLNSADQQVGIDYWLSRAEADWRNPERAALRPPGNPRDYSSRELKRDSADRRRVQAEQEAKRLLTPENDAAILAFHRRVKAEIDAAPTLLEQRARLLTQAVEELAEAKRLGDTAGERDLTELWTRTVILLHVHRTKQVGSLVQLEAKQPLPGSDQVSLRAAAWLNISNAAEKKQPETTADELLRAAAVTAARFPDDPAVLAGAADVLSFVAAVANRPDPIREYAFALRDHRFLIGASQLNDLRHPEKVEQARAAYKAATDLTAAEPDLVKAPGNLALRLYLRALAKDTAYRLPYLRLVLYNLEAGFDREAADRVLDQAIRREPRNAAPLLERAITAYAADEHLPEGVTRIREAARAGEFSRSAFVAMPAVLRPAFKFRPGLEELLASRWPRLDGVLGTLDDTQRAINTPDALMNSRLLTLRLADLLCQAPDYRDQVLGIERKARILQELTELPDGLTPQQKQQYARMLAEHRQRYGDYPKLTFRLDVRADGLRLGGSPSLEPVAAKSDPHLFIMSRGMVSMPF